MPRTGWRCRGNRCERRRLAGMKQKVSRLQVATFFPALTPVALRAPSVSAGKNQQKPAYSNPEMSLKGKVFGLGLVSFRF
jgi:hypothetical protein